MADGEWPAGELPELWDGKAADRIVRVLLESRGDRTPCETFDL